MSKTAFLTLLNRDDSVLSPHFGKAKWVAIVDDSGRVEFEQNTVLNGRAVVEIVARHGCKDVVFTEVGPGAYRQLQNAGIRGWVGASGVPLPVLAENLRSGELPMAEEPASGDHHGKREGCGGTGRGDACCCGDASS